MKTKKILVAGCALFLLVALLPALLGAETAPGQLPPEAQQAMKKGLIAVEQRDWNLAARYFEEARKAAPGAPEILFNLGLSESMIAGRELRAMAWFRAYLSAYPAAPNAQAVREAIDKLEVKTEGTMGKLIGQMKQLAGQFPDEGSRFSAYASVAVEMAKTGDLGGAAQMASLVPNNQEIPLESIAAELARAGDVAGAKNIASRINGQIFRSATFQDIAVAQADAGDTAGAWTTLESSTFPGYIQAGMIAIAKRLYKEGKRDEAYQALAKAADLTARSKWNDWQQQEKAQRWSEIGRAQAEIGDARGALRTADLIPQEGTVHNTNSRGDVTGSAVSSRYGDQWKGFIYSALHMSYQYGVMESSDDVTLLEEIASRTRNENERKDFLTMIGERKFKAVQEKLQASDARGATDAAGGIQDARYKSKAYEAIAKFFLDRGDPASAQAQIDSIPDGGMRATLYLSLARKFLKGGEERKARDMLSRARAAAKEKKDGYSLRDIATMQARSGDLDAARETVSMIQESGLKGSAYEQIARAQLREDDLSGARKTAGQMPEDSNKQSTLREIAIKEAESGKVDEAKRTASTISDESYKSWALRIIASEQAENGDFRGALGTAELIKRDTEKLVAHTFIAATQLNAGYPGAARETMEKAKRFVAGMNDPAAQADAYCSLADHMFYRHMTAEGRDLLGYARSAAVRVSDPEKRSQAYARGYSDLYRSLQGAGMLAPSRESIWSAVDAAYLIKGSGRGSRLESLATIQAGSGDIIGAGKTADRIEERERWENAIAALLSVKAAGGNLKAAEEGAAGLQSNANRDKVYLAILKARAEQGDIEGAKKGIGRISNQSRKNEAHEAIAMACLKAGDVAGAEAAASRFQGDPSYRLFQAMAKAGALDWAWRAAAAVKSDSYTDTGYFYRYIAEAQARSGDLEGAKKTSGLIEKDSHLRASIYAAVAKAGDTAWALESAAGLKNSGNRFQAYKGIAEAMMEKGDAAGAGRVLATIKKGGLIIRRARDVARLQAKMGDIQGAMDTLAAIHPKDAEFESWAGYEIASGQAEPQWRETASRIKDPYWRSRVFSEKAQSLEDGSAAQDAATAVPDALEKSLARLALVRKAIKAANLSGAIDLAGFIPDEECRMLALSEITFSGINRGDLTAVIPKIRDLPDSGGKAYILLDAAAGLVEAGNLKAAAPLLAAAGASAGTMPDGYWKARAFWEIAHAASSVGEQALSSEAGRLAEAAAGRMKEDEKGLWAEYRNRPEPPDRGQLEALQARTKRAEKWTEFIQRDLSKPLFMDIQGHLQSLGTSTRPVEIFGGISRAIDDTLAMLKKIKKLESEK